MDDPFWMRSSFWLPVLGFFVALNLFYALTSGSAANWFSAGFCAFAFLYWLPQERP